MEDDAMKDQKIIPDCTNCCRHEDCGKAEKGKLCPRWQSIEPNPKGIDPNEAWEKGL